MAKYKAAFLEDDVIDEEIEENVPEDNEDDLPAENREEETWKKRHGDLRRHAAKKEEELNNKLKELEERLEQAVRKEIKYPKTEEEVEQWMSKFPDVGKIVQTIALRANESTRQEVEGQFKKLSDLEKKISKEKEYMELLKVHPDFPEIKETDEFNDWVDNYPETHWIVKALYNDDATVEEASNAIDYYKRTVLDKQKPKDKKNERQDAAKSVPRGRAEAPAGNRKVTYSESMIKQNSKNPRWFEENEEAIEKAIRNGEFEYDITGAAR